MTRLEELKNYEELIKWAQAKKAEVDRTNEDNNAELARRKYTERVPNDHLYPEIIIELSDKGKTLIKRTFGDNFQLLNFNQMTDIENLSEMISIVNRLYKEYKDGAGFASDD